MNLSEDSHSLIFIFILILILIRIRIRILILILILILIRILILSLSLSPPVSLLPSPTHSRTLGCAAKPVQSNLKRCTFPSDICSGRKGYSTTSTHG